MKGCTGQGVGEGKWSSHTLLCASPSRNLHAFGCPKLSKKPVLLGFYGDFIGMFAIRLDGNLSTSEAQSTLLDLSGQSSFF